MLKTIDLSAYFLVFQKCLKKLLYSQITFHLTQNKFLSSLQSGFRRFHSCKSAVLKVSDDIRSAFDVILVMIDFSKAFDTINHKFLVEKLVMRFGFEELSANLLGSYLSGRTSVIFNNNSLSSPVVNVCGVPQGSMLGPLLFCMFIDDMVNAFKNGTPDFYADNTQINHQSRLCDIEQNIALVNDDLKRVTEWSACNGLIINEKKTQCIIFSRKSFDKSSLIRIKINNFSIDFVDTVQNLGVIMTSGLRWDKQITHNANRIYFDLRQG